MPIGERNLMGNKFLYVFLAMAVVVLFILSCSGSSPDVPPPETPSPTMPTTQAPPAAPDTPQVTPGNPPPVTPPVAPPQTARCGDGLVNVNSGEQCDLGAANGVCPSVCSSTCIANSCQQVPEPSLYTMTVREIAGVARTNEVLSSGVPLPRSADIKTTDGLVVIDTNGTRIPAEFHVLARWNAGLSDTNAPIEWLLVIFPATVVANGSTTYQLTNGVAGDNPLPANPLTILQNGNQFTVNTGAARFVFGGNARGLFDNITLLPSGNVLVSDGSMTAAVDGASTTHSTIRRAYMERQGPLSAVVVIEGAYDLAPIGNGGIGTKLRYVFTAGSPTAIVRQAVSWEGDKCQAIGGEPKEGTIACYDREVTFTGADGQQYVRPRGGKVFELAHYTTSPYSAYIMNNGVRVTSIKDSLNINVGAYPLNVSAVGAFAQPIVQGSIAFGQEVWVRQLLKANAQSTLSYDVNLVGSSVQNGQKADGGVLAVSGPLGAVAIAIDHMHRYEPQALRFNNGLLSLDIADGNIWLGQRQGMFATMAVSALASNPSRADLDQKVWAPLNHPLHAWPTKEWFAGSNTVDESPVGTLPANLATFDTLMPYVLDTTLTSIDQKGMSGLMTYGLFPRYWGDPINTEEVGCPGPLDPTPNESWDDVYWCSTWTDYHNTSLTAFHWAMRSSDTKWLDEITAPAALRSLHTQIMQCSPTDNWFFCGQAPAGYGGYRSDFNSSHAYFDNLIQYYWLTGDSIVINTLKRGADSMRGYMCDGRSGGIGAMCAPNLAPTDEWVDLTGRVGMQWYSVYRLLGLASDDASFLVDWKGNLARAITQKYVQAKRSNKDYGFWMGMFANVAPNTNIVSEQLFMQALYTTNMMYRLKTETNDEAITISIPPSSIRPSKIMEGLANTLNDFGPTVSGNGTAAGLWPNAFGFVYSGNNIGGNLNSVTGAQAGDPQMWDADKGSLGAAIMRGASVSTDRQSFVPISTDVTTYTINSALTNSTMPLGKKAGEYLSRLPQAVYWLTTP